MNGRIEESKVAANPRQRTEMGHVKAGRMGEDLVQKGKDIEIQLF